MIKTAAKKRKKKHGSSFQRWWVDHRDTVNAKRREKYHQDKKFREKTIQRVRRRYWERRPDTVKKRFVRRVEPSYTVLRDRQKQPAFGLEDVAQMLRRQRRTILHWIQRGVLPAPLRVACENRRVRVYLEEEFQLIRDRASLLGYPRKSLKKSVFANTLRRDMAYFRRGLLINESTRRSDKDDAHEKEGKVW